jgi:hypothetical protein
MNLSLNVSKKLLIRESEVTKKKAYGGRPTLYSEEMQKKADEYLDFSLFETYSKEIVVKDQIQTINLERPNSIPSIASLALHLGVHRETLYNWAKAERQFFDTLEHLRQKQQHFLEYHGLTRGYDSGFAKFLAVNVTEYKDKVEEKHEVNTTVKLAYKIDDKK